MSVPRPVQHVQFCIHCQKNEKFTPLVRTRGKTSICMDCGIEDTTVQCDYCNGTGEILDRNNMDMTSRPCWSCGPS